MSYHIWVYSSPDEESPEPLWCDSEEGPFEKPQDAIAYAQAEVGVAWIVTDENKRPIAFGDHLGGRYAPDAGIYDLKELRKVARVCYGSDDVNIDPLTPADLSIVEPAGPEDGGVWVRAWVWLSQTVIDSREETQE